MDIRSLLLKKKKINGGGKIAEILLKTKWAAREKWLFLSISINHRHKERKEAEGGNGKKGNFTNCTKVENIIVEADSLGQLRGISFCSILMCSVFFLPQLADLFFHEDAFAIPSTFV